MVLAAFALLLLALALALLLALVLLALLALLVLVLVLLLLLLVFVAIIPVAFDRVLVSMASKTSRRGCPALGRSKSSETLQYHKGNG